MKLPWLLEGSFRKEPPLQTDPKSRYSVSALCILVLAFSAFVLMSNMAFMDLQAAIKESLTSIGLGFSADFILAAVVLIAALAILLNEARLPLAILLGWMMLLPSLLYYSSVDWFSAVGLELTFGDLGNSLPGWVVFLNGFMLATTSLLLRSYLQLRDLRRNLIARGAIMEELDLNLRKDLLFNATIIGACALGTAAIAILVVVLTPGFTELSSIAPYLYLVVGLAVELLIIVSIARFLKTGRIIKTRGTAPER